MDKTAIKDIAFGSIYTDDFQTAYKFYKEVIGLEKEFDMGDLACFFKLGEKGLYLQGGNKKQEYSMETMHASFTLIVESASAMYAKLKAVGIKFVHQEPMQMGPEDYWFCFYDPTGVIVEILGGK